MNRQRSLARVLRHPRPSGSRVRVGHGRQTAILLECGGKRSATPLWNLRTAWGLIGGSRPVRRKSKAPSPLRSAGALQNLAGHPSVHGKSPLPFWNASGPWTSILSYSYSRWSS